MTNKDLANLLFPNVTKTIEDYEKIYPERNLPEGAMVTRFAPSPTGYMHIGNLRTALYEYLIANNPNNSWLTEFKQTKEYRLLYE